MFFSHSIRDLVKYFNFLLGREKLGGKLRLILRAVAAFLQKSILTVVTIVYM